MIQNLVAVWRYKASSREALAYVMVRKSLFGSVDIAL